MQKIEDVKAIERPETKVGTFSRSLSTAKESNKIKLTPVSHEKKDLNFHRTWNFENWKEILKAN